MTSCKSWVQRVKGSSMKLHASICIYIYIYMYMCTHKHTQTRTNRHTCMLTPKGLTDKIVFPTCFMLLPGPGSPIVLRDNCFEVTTYKFINAFNSTITTAIAEIVPGMQKCRIAESAEAEWQNCKIAAFHRL